MHTWVFGLIETNGKFKRCRSLKGASLRGMEGLELNGSCTSLGNTT